MSYPDHDTDYPDGHDFDDEPESAAQTPQDGPRRTAAPGTIDDTTARRIASEWHGGGGTALYALSSTGAIDTARADHDVKTEIVDSIHDRIGHTLEEDTTDLNELRRLLDYVNATGARGPVDGWATLTWEHER